ncbi:MAG: ATP-binding protein, partial [Nocardioidaceae bacterium]
LSRAGLAGDCLAEVEVALSEACTNVFMHARKGDTYEVAINVGEEFLTVDVTDTGGGFEPGAPPSTLPGPTAESGRGTTLMRAFTDRTTFDSIADGGGSVHLTKKLRWADGSSVLDGHPA